MNDDRDEKPESHAGAELSAGSGVQEAERWISEVGSQADGAAGTKPAARLDFEEIVRKHGRRLFLLAFRLTGDRADAEDLSQETLVRGYMASSRFEGRADFYTYLHRALLNLWKNHLRRRRRWRMVPLFGSRSAEAGVERGAPGSDGGGPAGRLADPSPGPHERLVRHQQAEKLQRALMRLHPDFRAVLVLRVGEGLEYEEIAASLGIPIGTVRSRLARARERVRALMER